MGSALATSPLRGSLGSRGRLSGSMSAQKVDEALGVSRQLTLRPASRTALPPLPPRPPSLQGFHARQPKPHSSAHASAAARAKRRQSAEARWPVCDARTAVENSVLGMMPKVSVGIYPKPLCTRSALGIATPRMGRPRAAARAKPPACGCPGVLSPSATPKRLTMEEREREKKLKLESGRGKTKREISGLPTLRLSTLSGFRLPPSCLHSSNSPSRRSPPRSEVPALRRSVR